MHNLNKLRFHLQIARYRLFRARCILTCLYHRSELSSLVQWAKRKRRAKQCRYYQSCLQQIEESLFWYGYRDRWLFRICRLLFEIRLLLASQQRTRPAGSAARYHALR